MSLAMPRMGERYAPLYFLASLGAGGLAVTFFMFLMFWVPHPDAPVPVFEDIAAAFAAGNAGLQAAIVLAMAGIAFFAFLNLRLLVWNLRELAAFRGTAGWKALTSSNAETQLLAMPLALAMSVNVGFVLGLTFVPGLWGVVEFLFPVAIVAFLAIGGLALRQLGTFLGRVLAEPGQFKQVANNSFAQLLPGFALTMVGVGLAAPAALSASPLVAGIGLLASGFFLTVSAIWIAVAVVLAIASMLENGVAAESAPTLMIVVPILTVAGILTLRSQHGLDVHFGAHPAPGETLAFLGKLLSAQVAFLAVGLLVMARQGYAGRWLFGGERSPGSYALVCPGVAMAVMIHFFVNKGLVEAGLLAKFSTGYWALTAVALAFQVAMIWLVFHLNRLHFARREEPVAVPAE
ncbi:MAG: hypothetical protein JJU40_06740 [Rhodobacteraceae bacterium]|nr:hypothetical protein [Paracoccaceae bacterium]